MFPGFNLVNCYRLCSLHQNHHQMIMFTGDAEVPVADCTAEQFSSHPKTKMRFADFISYLKTVSTTCSDPPSTCTDEEPSTPHQKTDEEPSAPHQKNRLLYLKDWHFVRYRTLQIRNLPHTNTPYEVVHSLIGAA